MKQAKNSSGSWHRVLLCSKNDSYLFFPVSFGPLPYSRELSSVMDIPLTLFIQQLFAERVTC